MNSPSQVQILDNPICISLAIIPKIGGAHGVMVIIVRNRHGDSSSNPG